MLNLQCKFFYLLIPQMEKCAKDQADGWGVRACAVALIVVSPDCGLRPCQGLLALRACRPFGAHSTGITALEFPFLPSPAGPWPARCYDDACGGHADGWGVRACAVALTVGLIFCTLFHQGKSVRKKVGKDLLPTFHPWKV